MINIYCRRLRNSNQFKIGPITHYFDGYASFLSQKGYSYSSGRRFIREIDRLNIWMYRRGLKIHNLNEILLRKYIKKRKNSRPLSKLNNGPYLTLLEYLRIEKVIKAIPINRAKNTVDKIIEKFGIYLEEVRGISRETIRHQIHFVRMFLLKQFEAKECNLRKIKGADLSNYIIKNSKGKNNGRVSALRTFCRYMFLKSYNHSDLSGSLPWVRQWQHSPLPSYLKDSEINSLLKQCDRKSPKGCRDFAILLILIKLGLRAIEVQKLELQDIDWKTGQVTIHGKSRRQEKLPLPQDVGKALIAYIKYSRPSSVDQNIFIRINAPHRALKTSSPISAVVRKSLKRAGLETASTGSHLLRHTCATNLLRRGASLTEIGQILRHSSLRSTMIYAKVDIKVLQQLSEKWPGGSK